MYIITNGNKRFKQAEKTESIQLSEEDIHHKISDGLKDVRDRNVVDEKEANKEIDG